MKTHDDVEVARRLAAAIEVAVQAGRDTLPAFRAGNPEVVLKADETPVTMADRKAEEAIREAIARRFPRDAVLGEEFGESSGTSGFRWVLDPIDGTHSFIQGVPLYGTLVGVERDGEVCLGVAVLPALGEYLYAAKGQGAWWVRQDGAPRQAQVTQTSRLSDSFLCMTSLHGFELAGRVESFERMRGAVKRMRGWGDCFGYCLVATGRADVMLDPLMSPWDCAALKPIVEEAGGVFTDWTGAPTIYGKDGVATNGRLHAEVLRILAEEGA